MTDKEKTEEDKFRQTLQDACSFSDEQLLRDLEKAEKALGEFEFSGAEERIFKKLMEREAINTERMRGEEGEEGKEGEEKAAEKVPGTVPEVTSQKEPEAAMVKAPGTTSVEALRKAPEVTSQTTSEENSDKATGEVSEKISEATSQKALEAATVKAPGTASAEALRKAPEVTSQTTSEENADKALGEVSEKMPEVTSQKEPEAATVKVSEKGKVIRFGRRKRMLMVALIAAFVGMLGAKAVGEDSYFFQLNLKSAGVILDNGRNYLDVSDVDEAYKLASQELNIKILRLGYIPKHMKFIELNINENKAVFVFSYEGDKRIHLSQVQRLKETSFNSSSDTDRKDIVVHNKWIDQDVYIREEAVDSQKGYSAVITMDNGVYRLTGVIPEEEMKKIVENLNFH